jgi:multisubunit Na+/H+ antiporter MnhB subunit
VRKAKEAVQWRWSSEDSRDMWMDAAKTMITASGIAAALLASLTVGHQTMSPLVVYIVKSATVCLVVCVCVSMFLFLALARGHETAKSRYTEKRRQEGYQGEIREGPLSNFALCIILSAALIALSGFFLGFLFLARIVWHI